MAKASQIRSVETLACDAGWRNYHFVKIMTEADVALLQHQMSGKDIRM